MQAAKDRKSIYRIWIMAAVAFVLLFVRSRYGFSYDDEPFLLTLAQRLYYGDSLFIDEWNFAQNAGVLLLPFYRLYISLFGTLDYILLTFRGLYCFFWVVTCTLLYSVLRKKYKGAWAAYFYLLLFSPLDQMTLSYTSIALMCVLLIATLFFRHLEVKAMKLWSFTVLFSIPVIIAVIASPYLGFVYGIYVLGCVIFGLLKRSDRAKFFMKSALLSVLIAFVALILYAWRFILNNYSLTEFIEKLPNMFAKSSMGTTVSKRGNTLTKMVVDFWRNQLIVGGTTFLLALIPRVRKSALCRAVLFSANALVFGYEMLQQLGIKGLKPRFNLQMMPIVFLGYLSWWMLRDKKKHNSLLFAFTGVGIGYAYVSYVSSNTGLPALSMGLTVCGVFGIIMVYQLAQELVDSIKESEIQCSLSKMSQWIKRLIPCYIITVTALVIVSQIFVQSYLKIHRHYVDDSVPEMDYVITTGASKGIKTTYAGRGEFYERRMEVLTHMLQYVDMEKKNDIRFLTLVFDPDLYLNADLPVGSYSVWTHASTKEGWNGVSKKLSRYYSINPSKVPNVILTSTHIYDWDVIPMPDIDLSNYEEISYKGYILYVAPEFLRQ